MMRDKFKSKLFEFAYFPKYDESIEYLATQLADRDDQWDFSDATKKSYSILKNYLEHYFRKIMQEKKISFTNDNKFAVFNTGLVTENWEEIYAMFEIYRIPNPKYPDYCFQAFVKKSNAQLLKHFSGNLPDIADFFQDPSNLIFNPKCELIPDIDHIIEDNLTRFPKHMQRDGNAEMRRKLDGAIKEVTRKVRTNYKIAVPQHFNGKVQLLLPLCLTPNSPNPDLALVIYKVNDTTYVARTCLTLQMAYNNARLIVKPQSSWLKP